MTAPGDMEDMEDLAGSDLDRAHESLYYAAKRYCLITEKGFLQESSRICHHDADFVSIGQPAAQLAEAAQRYTEAYARYEAYLPPETDPDEDED